MSNTTARVRVTRANLSEEMRRGRCTVLSLAAPVGQIRPLTWGNLTAYDAGNIEIRYLCHLWNSDISSPVIVLSLTVTSGAGADGRAQSNGENC